MDQIFQLQRQIQDLRQEVNSINQVASQLQRSEASNATQLQRLQQNETIAAQQLQTIQQLCNRLSQDVNVISNVAQHVTSHMVNKPFASGQYGTGAFNQFGTGQFGSYGTGINTGYYSPTQLSSTGTQAWANANDEFLRNQQISSMAANRYGIGLNTPAYTSNQQLNSMANQSFPISQSNMGMSSYGAGTMATGIGQTGFTGTSTGNFAVQPTHPMQTSYYGTTGLTGSQYNPAYNTSQFSLASQPATGLYGSQTMMGAGAQNIGRYSSF